MVKFLSCKYSVLYKKRNLCSGLKTGNRIECFSFEKGRREAEQRRPAQSERKNRAFFAKRQAVWFEMGSIPK